MCGVSGSAPCARAMRCSPCRGCSGPAPEDVPEPFPAKTFARAAASDEIPNQSGLQPIRLGPLLLTCVSCPLSLCQLIRIEPLLGPCAVA